MSIQRKCLKCQTWNKNEDYCAKCGELLSPKLIEEKRESVREEIRRNKPPSKLDTFILNWKNSPNYFVKAIYYILYSIGFIFFTIAAFFVWLTASPNG